MRLCEGRSERVCLCEQEEAQDKVFERDRGGVKEVGGRGNVGACV